MLAAPPGEQWYAAFYSAAPQGQVIRASLTSTLPLLYLHGVFRAFAHFKWILCSLIDELYKFFFFKYMMVVCLLPHICLESIYYVSLKYVLIYVVCVCGCVHAKAHA